MRTNPLYIARLIRRKFNGELTNKEAGLLQDWLAQDSRNFQLLEQLEEEMKSGMNMQVLKSFDESRAWAELSKGRRKQFVLYWARIAAVLALVVGFSFFALKHNKQVDTSRIVESKDERYKNDILPAIKGAKIVLENGTEVKVDDNVTLLADGSISTDEKTIIADAPSTMINKLVVPAAHFLHMTLSDGTKVWINASSELEFPSQFTKDRRQVKLKGEAYFQVTRDQDRPFVIETVGGNVKVLGTHFNISAYTDRPVTTLEEGKVMVYKDHLQEILSPGMKAEIVGSRIDVRKADLQKELAWKNNLFYFKGDNIVSIAKELQNWYDLEVSFSKGVSLSQTYTGEISRSVNLTEVLNMLEFVSDLDFKIDNNKLVIFNKNKL